MLHRLLLLSVLVAAVVAEDWHQITPFAAIGLHGRGPVIVAWSSNQFSLSRDTGRSWSPPIAVQDGGMVQMIRRGVVGQGGEVMLLSGDGGVFLAQGPTVMRLPTRAVAAAVDGTGAVYGQDLSGSIVLLPSGAPVPSTGAVQGTLVAGLSAGVLVQAPGGFARVATVGVQPVSFRESDPAAGAQALPALPLVVAGGGDRWVSADGTAWMLKGQALSRQGRREIQVHSLSYVDGAAPWEVSSYQGRVALYEPVASGRQPHLRSAGLPAGVTAVAVLGGRLVAVAPQGIYGCTLQ